MKIKVIFYKCQHSEVYIIVFNRRGIFILFLFFFSILSSKFFKEKQSNKRFLENLPLYDTLGFDKQANKWASISFVATFLLQTGHLISAKSKQLDQNF